MCNTQQTLKKIMDVHSSNSQRILKNEQKLGSFSAKYKQHLKYDMSGTDVCKFMSFKLVKHINPNYVMKTFTTPNCSLTISGIWFNAKHHFSSHQKFSSHF